MTSDIAVIRVRGVLHLKKDIEDTLEMLKLYKKNFCVVLKPTPQNLGMIKKVKDFVTYGEIDENTFGQLVEKKGEEYTARTNDSKNLVTYKGKFFEHNGKKYKKYFRLNPPLKGYGRKGIKKAFSQGGALGDRKEKINDLIQRMI